MSHSVKLAPIRKSHSFSLKPARSRTRGSMHSDPEWSLQSGSLKVMICQYFSLI